MRIDLLPSLYPLRQQEISCRAMGSQRVLRLEIELYTYLKNKVYIGPSDDYFLSSPSDTQKDALNLPVQKSQS